MGGTRARVFAVVALGMSPGCSFDSSGGASGAASVGDDTAGDTGVHGTSSSAMTSAGQTDDAADTGDTGPGDCPPGANGCPCDGESCDVDLACANGTCVPADCGNGRVEANEQCDDQNDQPDDGCEPNCSFSIGAAQIATGKDHTCVVTFAGKVRCWGIGTDGRTGQGADEPIGDDELPSVAIDVPFEPKVKFIGLGDGFGCALLANDHVACWGRNNEGRLGLGTAEPAVLDTPGERMTEVGLGVAVDWLAVGTAHACVVLQGGGVRCWGHGGKGRLGYGDDAMAVGDDETPLDKPLVEVGGVARSIAAGNEHTCVLLDDGAVRCWGEADRGRLGTGDTSEDIGDDEAPSTTTALDFGGAEVRDIFVGGDVGCATVGDLHELWCWGDGANGRLGTGTPDPLYEPTEIPTGGETEFVALGWNHSCVLLDHVDWQDAIVDGVVRRYGEGMEGQLGAQGVVDLGDDEGEELAELAPVRVVGDDENRRVLQIAGGEAHTCVTTTGGAVRCWGNALGGRLGYGNENSIGDTEPPADAGDVQFE